MDTKTERQLATIRKIEEIKPIEGAEAIEAVRVDGWWVVAKKGEYQVNDLAVYCETDSWIPTAVAPFLTKPGHEPKEFEGVKGERLRTIKLRGQLSQGLLLPCAIAAERLSPGELWAFDEGDDVTEALGILKWDKPIPAQLAGMVKGNFPSFIPKTDQPRIQNMKRNWEDKLRFENWEVSEKLDGSSMTVYVRNVKEARVSTESIEFGVCSRNLDLKFDENNSFWEAAIKYDLVNKLMSTGRSLALQGELIGEGIQGNSYKLTGRKFYCFDIYDIDNQCYLLPLERIQLLRELDIAGVPIIYLYTGLEYQDVSVDSLLKGAEGKSAIGCNPEREGLVFKSISERDLSFKVISNKWLILND